MHWDVAEDLPRLRDLFDSVVDLPASEREMHLRQAGVATLLRDRVLQLVAAHDISTSRATELKRRVLAASVDGETTEVGVGDSLGVWLLTKELGRGGMGAVFLAERVDGLFDQQAAVKVLRGAPDAAALALLAKERRILARLAHPGIARLLDGGTTPLGQPYLVMEQVQGERLDHFLTSARPDRATRIALFLAICDAVTYAHAALVIHCDLKPSNVLVDAKARPVLLDFGIARLASAGQDTDTTDAIKAYTPGYASPELERGGLVGTLSDVYSLGVVLRDLIGNTPDADLQAIAARATRTDPVERYGSVQLLAQDVVNARDGLPVVARGNRPAYRLGVLLRRRWAAFVGATLFAGLVVAFGWRLGEERDVALAARERADQEAATAQAGQAFLQSVFEGADVEKQGGRDVTALDLLERGRTRVDTELADQPAVQSIMYASLSQAYASLGERPKAGMLIEQGITIERTLVPPRPLQLASMLGNAALLDAQQHRFAKAEAKAREALALAESHAAPKSRPIGIASTALALSIDTTKPEEAKALLLRHLDIRQHLGEPRIDLASTWHNLGLNASTQNQTEEAIRFHRLALEAKRQALGDGHARTINSVQALAGAYLRANRFAEALPLFRQALEVRRTIQGEDSAHTVNLKSELAFASGGAGDYAACLVQYDDVLAATARSIGKESMEYARYRGNQGSCLEAIGLQKQAQAAYGESLHLRRKLLPAGDPGIARAEFNLGRSLLYDLDLVAAPPLIESAHAVRLAKLGAGHEETISSAMLLADLALAQGSVADARRQLSALSPLLPRASGKVRATAERLDFRIAVVERRAVAAQAAADRFLSQMAALYGNAHPLTLRARLDILAGRRALGERVDGDVAVLARQMRASPAVFPPESVIHAELAALDHP